MFFLLWYFDVFCHGTFVGDWGAQDKPWISIRFLFPKGALKRPESQRLLQKVLALDVFFVSLVPWQCLVCPWNAGTLHSMVYMTQSCWSRSRPCFMEYNIGPKLNDPGFSLWDCVQARGGRSAQWMWMSPPYLNSTWGFSMTWLIFIHS